MINFFKKNIKALLFIFYYLLVLCIKLLPHKKSFLKGALIIKLDNIGDYFLCRNFWSDLKKKYSEQSITLLGNVAYKEIAEKLDQDIFSKFIWIDMKKFIKNPFYAFQIFHKLHQQGFEIVIQPTLSRSWGDLFVLAANADVKIGSLSSHAIMPRFIEKLGDTFYSNLFSLDQEKVFELFWYQLFFSEICRKKLLIPTFLHHQKQHTISLFIGASQDFRLWDISHVITVMDWLLKNSDYQLQILGGKRELALTAKIDAHFPPSKHHHRITNLVAKQTLLGLVDTIATSSLLISNDTLAPHVAAQTKTPFICISNGSSFGRFHPYPKEIFDKGIYLYPKEFTEAAKNSTYYEKHFGHKTNYNINSIYPEQVIEALQIHDFSQ